MDKKVILAFSGGLDTSFCVVKLKEQGYSVVTVLVDTGGFDKNKVKEIERKAYRLGAYKHYTIYSDTDIYNNVIGYLIKANGLYQGIYPQMCADRYVIVEKCINITKKEKTNLIAHGCTAMGNDQIRFDVSIRALGDYEIIAPIRDLQSKVKGNIRQYEIEYLNKRGFSIPKAHKRYSINQNVLGVTISGSEIDRCEEPDEEAFVLTKVAGNRIRKQKYIKVSFRGGLPVALNGKKAMGIDILRSLNREVGKYGCGRFIYTGDCIIGIKGRIAFECPGLYALITAHRALEEAVLSPQQNQFKDIISKKWAQLVYSGLYFDPLREDIERFIDNHQRYVTGEVTLKVTQANIIPVSYSSNYIPKERETVYAQSSSWSPDEANGFGKLFGIGTVLANVVRKK
ncbi:MAG: argininosuccinate synthase [Candidatus Schekmanbacteria bacterium RBG_16_38_10]|uniref:argininosuccinate synthase n=1 Tax=Candidatus Schekmanbacteria bacterium RBG_16_38_10 TaxID=1817879 RepID=A0A1F7S292_9BACT|nr:MAG: argininosuccinate synthase [Candidatus Schekmanbacteria bacterium RBG_16_38_10]